MWDKLKKLRIFATATLLVLMLSSTFLFLVHFIVAVLFLFQLPENLPLGMNSRLKLEQNFQKQRPTLEAIVATVRTDDLGTVGFERWGLRGYTLPPVGGANYRPFYRAMR